MTTASGCDDPPSLGPLEIAREIPALPRAPIRGPSPGHQAGAPLRRGACGGACPGRRPSPGHQAGAPLRRMSAGNHVTIVGNLPPAIRPGLHCGMLVPARRPVPRGPLPPAIRPGLHCGFFGGHIKPVLAWASPGHQAGAPLRRYRRGDRQAFAIVFPRPSGRGSIAAEAASPAPTANPTFPRPSGRGSIAARGHCFSALLIYRLPPAIRPGLHCGTRRPSRCSSHVIRLPPAIRPGLHCGTAATASGVSGPSFPRPSGRGSIAAAGDAVTAVGSVGTSPGHQAGAPLRQVRLMVVMWPVLGLPPAIRPGLHCGLGGEVDRTVWAALPSPGHQAGAPLRPLDCGGAAPDAVVFPRPSGRGSIAAIEIRQEVPVNNAFPRPSGRGSIAAARPAGRRAAPRRFPRPSGRGSIAAKCGVGGAESHVLASPGHQAGAPLRRQGAAPRDDEAGDLPPAIRPGLHCGVTAI